MKWWFILLLAGCGGGVIQRVDALPPSAPGEGWLSVSCEPKDVDLYIDGAYRGTLDGYRRGLIRVPAGRRRVKLSKVGFFPWYGEIEATHTPSPVQTHLVPEVP